MTSMFKAVTAYRMVEPLKDLHDLQNLPFKPIPKFGTESHGWINPAGDDKRQPFYELSGDHEFVILCLASLKKTLKKSSVHRETSEEIKRREKDSGVILDKIEIESIRQSVTNKAMANALPDYSEITGFIDWSKNMIFVNSSSIAECDQFFNCLRMALGSCKVEPVVTKMLPETVMKDWIVNNSAPPHFKINGDITFHQPGDNSIKATTKHYDLDSHAIEGFIEDNMVPCKISFEYRRESIITIDSASVICSLKILGDEIEQEFRSQDLSNNENSENLEFESTLMINCYYVRGLMSELFTLFGGICN